MNLKSFIDEELFHKVLTITLSKGLVNVSTNLVSNVFLKRISLLLRVHRFIQSYKYAKS